MRDKESKKKLHESKIGKIIYGFLLFMPLFAIGVTCLVNTFNNEAKAEQQIEYKYKTNVVNTFDDLVVGNIYHLKVSRNQFNATATVFIRTKAVYVDSSTYLDSASAVNSNYFSSQFYNTGSYRFLTYNSAQVILTINTQSEYYEFDFVYYDNTNFDNFTFEVTQCENIPINNVTTKNISNIFYYAVDKVTQSNLFNWVTTSNIYTGMSNFTTAMSVTNTFIPMLLTYWLIISVIYFLYDMVLVLLTVLHRKIHNLQDSI